MLTAMGNQVHLNPFAAQTAVICRFSAKAYGFGRLINFPKFLYCLSYFKVFNTKMDSSDEDQNGKFLESYIIC